MKTVGHAILDFLRWVDDLGGETALTLLGFLVVGVMAYFFFYF